MFRTAIIAAVFASAAFAAGCGDDSPMMLPDVDGGTTPPPVPPPTPVPPTPVPPPPMDAGSGTVCTPTADNPLCVGAGSCQCDNSGLTDFIAAHPEVQSELDSMSYCSPGLNHCGLSLPPTMPSYTPGFDCAAFVTNDLWIGNGEDSVLRGRENYDHANGQFILPFPWMGNTGAVCMGRTCYDGWSLMHMGGDLGVHYLITFSDDCTSATAEYYPADADSPVSDLTLIVGWVEDCGDGFGDCP